MSKTSLKYLTAYAPEVRSQIQTLIDNHQLKALLLDKYPTTHDIRTSKALYDYTMAIKDSALRKSPPLSKVIYDDKIHVIKDALGLHTYISRVQGKKLKAKSEIRISTLFKRVPDAFLKMIVVHELAHLKEKEHNKAFYQLCQHMEPNYHQLEFDLRLYLTQIEIDGAIYT